MSISVALALCFEEDEGLLIESQFCAAFQADVASIIDMVCSFN